MYTSLNEIFPRQKGYEIVHKIQSLSGLYLYT